MTDREHHRRCKKCKHFQAVHWEMDGYRCWEEGEPGCFVCTCVLYTPDHTLKYLLARKLRLTPSIKD